MREQSSESLKTRGKILVVDDEEVIADFMKRALSLSGFEVDCASDGERAYGMLSRTSYDLIIADLRMPGPMNGRSLFLKLREENPDLARRLVFITGDTIEQATERFLRESERPFLLKPFSIKDLRDVVAGALSDLDCKTDATPEPRLDTPGFS